ncbi:50S ribosomal protein L18 [Candidatus Parcubacteria bacterium]|nr:MAG: 50S ribosomal protein L18 [Candidatus Parcubacteria bacterium]
MKDKNKVKRGNFLRRQKRTRANITGTSQKPRVSVFKSLMHVNVQAIDDISGKTLLALADKTLKFKGTKTEKAANLGEEFGKKLKSIKIDSIAFDKGAYKYHGRVKALADGIRKAGINF